MSLADLHTDAARCYRAIARLDARIRELEAAGEELEIVRFARRDELVKLEEVRRAIAAEESSTVTPARS